MTDATGLPAYPAAEELTPQAVAEFRRWGVLRLRGAMAPAQAERCRDHLWRGLAGRGVDRDDPSTWSRILSSEVKALARHPDFAVARLPRVAAAIQRLLGPDWAVPSSGGTFLLKPPTPPTDVWTMPRCAWHWDGRLDEPSGGSLATHALMAPLATRHGGTMYAVGSHVLVRRLFDELPAASRHERNKSLRTRFRERHPWFAALERSEPPSSAEVISAMMDRSFQAEGQELRIVDVHGEAGDVVIAAGSMIHSAPSRVAPGPRLVHLCGVHGALASS